MNIRGNNKISDKEILKNIAKTVNRSITMMADDMNEKKGTLFQITAGRNNISAKIKAKILDTYPIISDYYIETGQGDIKTKPQSQHDEAFIEEIFMRIAKMEVEIKSLSSKISTLIIALANKS